MTDMQTLSKRSNSGFIELVLRLVVTKISAQTHADYAKFSPMSCCIIIFQNENENITVEPITAEPVTAEPVTAEPITAAPITTEPRTAEPKSAKPSNQDARHIEDSSKTPESELYTSFVILSNEYFFEIRFRL